MKTTENINNQDRATIKKLNPNPIARTFIYSGEQQRRAKIVQLINNGLLPHHTDVGKGLSGRKHWRVEKYRGNFGKGFKMFTTSPLYSNFNHITYFTIT